MNKWISLATEAKTAHWKRLEQIIESVTENTGRDAWVVANVVYRLLKDDKYRDQRFSGSESARITRLSIWSGKFCLKPEDMFTMIDQRGDIKYWESGRLDILLDEAIKSREQDRLSAHNSPDKKIQREQYDRDRLERHRRQEREASAEADQMLARPTISPSVIRPNGEGSGKPEAVGILVPSKPQLEPSAQLPSRQAETRTSSASISLNPPARFSRPDSGNGNGHAPPPADVAAELRVLALLRDELKKARPSINKMRRLAGVAMKRRKSAR